MTNTVFQDTRACVFDAYGTLFDVHTAVAAHQGRIGAHAQQVSAVWRTKQLEYTWLRSLMGRYGDFWNVTKDALDFALETYGVVDDKLRADLLAAYGHLGCYPEVRQVLTAIKAAGIPCLVLSNGTPQMLDEAIDNADLTGLFEGVLTADVAQIYKPDPRVYQLAVARTGLEPGKIAFQSSNAWDIAGAASFGFRTAWINRFEQKRERLPFSADAELRDLRGLPSLLGLAGE